MNKACNGNYESAMHYDCEICEEEDCPYRKSGLQYISGIILIIGILLPIILILI
jgi:hypothetical protein